MALKPKDAPDLSRFDWEDALRLEDQLTEDERMLRDAARAFAQSALAPRVTAAYREETTDPAIFAEMGAAGLLGVAPTGGVLRFIIAIAGAALLIFILQKLGIFKK